MSDFMRYIFWQLGNSLLAVLLAGGAFLGLFGVLYLLRNKKCGADHKVAWSRGILWLIFAAYLVVLLYVTIFRSSLGNRAVNLHLFRAWREAWNAFSEQRWLNVLLNIAMFVPLGFLLPLLGKGARKWYVTIPVGIAASLGIELIQLLLASGVCDVDDLFCNSLGGAIGYCAIMGLLSLGSDQENRWKRVLTFGCLTLAPVVAIGSIFVAYHWKEFGNLPTASAYRVDTKNVTWTLECTLPDVLNNTSVYQAKPMSREDCDTFAEEMAALDGKTVAMASYYQEMAYYHLSQGILMVYYHSGQFEFMDYGYDAPYGTADRDTLETALEKYPVRIPDTAEFAEEGEGWYRFSCDGQVIGDVMLDGSLRVYYDADGYIRQIENRLGWYTYYRHVPIISPEDAYELLCGGNFSDGDLFTYRAPGEVRVFSCVLDYEIDTKGFYQPVYRFDVASPDGAYQACIMIPAMK